MTPQGTVREWDGMGKRDQGYSRPGTGRMSHGIPGHPTAKSDNPPFCYSHIKYNKKSPQACQMKWNFKWDCYELKVNRGTSLVGVVHQHLGTSTR